MNAEGKSSLTDDKGSAQIIEMTVIFPFVLICVFFLVYLCSYILQGIAIYNSAQRIAMAAAREAAFPGYGELCEGEGITTTTDFNWENGYAPAINIINKIMKVHAPYRYWGNNFLGEGKKEKLEKNLMKLINNNSFFPLSNVNCTILTSNNILNQRIEVRVIKRISLPKIVNCFGLMDNISIDVTAAAIVGDTAELIRNTDMVLDLTDYIFSNLKIGKSGQTINEKIFIYKQKFNDIGSRLGLEW